MCVARLLVWCDDWDLFVLSLDACLRWMVIVVYFRVSFLELGLLCFGLLVYDCDFMLYVWCCYVDVLLFVGVWVS